jgi:hypothetical protein
MYHVKILIPLEKRLLRRQSNLLVNEVSYCAFPVKWLAYFVSWFIENSYVLKEDNSEVVEYGDELADEFCEIYGIKETRQAWGR